MTDLLACAHGTADPRGRREIHALVREMARQRPDLRISLGFVDVDYPALPDLVDRLVADGTDVVIVPLLLSAGYHVNVDIRAVCRPGVTAAPALGPDEVLVDVLIDRLGPLYYDRIVLAAAGSSDPSALLDCELTGSMLAERTGLPVEVGYVSGAGPRLTEVVRRGAGTTAVATYLLSPGFFVDAVRRIARESGAASCSSPLAPDPRLATLALHRSQQPPTDTFVRHDNAVTAHEGISRRYGVRVGTGVEGPW